MMIASPRPLSIVIMTYNEEASIAQCLTSVQGLGDEILVLDSYSTDKTTDIARSLGARVEQCTFDSYANQRRRMIQMAKNDWILTLDADEYLSDALKASVKQTEYQNSFDGYTSNRRSRIGNVWMNHGSWYPDKKIRLFDRRKISVAGHDVHETLVPITQARIGHLEGDLMHHADENIAARYHKIQNYSSRAAEQLFKQGRKTNSWRILFKPFIRFVSVYLIRLGILDGFYGYVIAKSEAQYVWLREVKLRERWRSAPKYPKGDLSS